MTPHYVITRTRDTVTSICRSCGDTSGTTRTDAQAERWQRSHQAECPQRRRIATQEGPW